jgi:hypothetical protein
MTATATQLTEKFRKDVERVSQDKVQGETVQRLRSLFAPAPAIRAKRSVLIVPSSEHIAPVVRTVRTKRKRKSAT